MLEEQLVQRVGTLVGTLLDEGREAMAKRVKGEPTELQARCERCYDAALRGLESRYTLAEISLAVLGGDERGDLVELTRRIMPDPPTGPIRGAVLAEAYVSAFLFGAWSTLETATFGANAVGCLVDEARFYSLMTNDVSHVDPRSVLPGKRGRHAAFLAVLPEFTRTLTSEKELVVELFEQHSASKHRYSTMSGWATATSGSTPQEKLEVRAPTDFFLREDPRDLDRRAVLNKRLDAPLPAQAKAFSEPSVALAPIVNRWRQLVPLMLSALLADVRRLGDG